MAVYYGPKKKSRIAGPDSEVLVVKFTPNGTGVPSIQENRGGASVAYSATGVWIATLPAPVYDIAVMGCLAVPGDTNFHEIVHAKSVSARTVTLTHRTVTYANIVSAGPAASNTCGEITLTLLVRRSP